MINSIQTAAVTHSGCALTEIYQMAGHLIRRLNQISVSVFAERMAREGFDFTPVQFAALSTVDANPGLDQATLAGLIAYDRATLGGVVDRLEQKQLIRRSISRVDRRARELFLTAKGKKMLCLLKPIVAALQDDILIGLSEKEKGQMMRLLEKATSAGNELSRAPLQIEAAS